MTMITEPGIYPELSDRYFTENLTPSPYLSQSGIKILLNETPFDYRNPPARKATGDMDFGSIVHAIALGKGSKFAVSPYDDYRTKDARAWRDETIEAGIIPVKADKWQDAVDMGEVIRSKVEKLLGGAEYQTEVPFFWQEGETWCGGMMDIWCPDLLVAIDPKVTKIVGKRAPAHIVNIGWDIQAAWYRRGLEQILPDDAGRIRFVNLLIKPEAPFTSRAIMLNEAWRSSAEAECIRALRIFQRCSAANEWPGYSDEIEALDAPGWTLNERMMAEMETEEDE
jgi:hypothetical protein